MEIFFRVQIENRTVNTMVLLPPYYVFGIIHYAGLRLFYNVQIFIFFPFFLKKNKPFYCYRFAVIVSNKNKIKKKKISFIQFETLCLVVLSSHFLCLDPPRF